MGTFDDYEAHPTNAGTRELGRLAAYLVSPAHDQPNSAPTVGDPSESSPSVPRTQRAPQAGAKA